MAECMKCKGNGRVLCKECGGKGIMSYYLFHMEYGESSEFLHNGDEIDCKECHGIGNVICEKCNGRGYIISQ